MDSNGPKESCVRWGSSGAEGRCHGNPFWPQFAIIGFVGYNFGCMIASDTLFDSMGSVFGVKLSDEDIADFGFRSSTGRCHGNRFWLSILVTLVPPGEYD